MGYKVVTQCSACGSPICDGDRFIRTKYGDFCTDCYTEETAVYHEEEPNLDDMFPDLDKDLAKLTVWGDKK